MSVVTYAKRLQQLSRVCPDGVLCPSEQAYLVNGTGLEATAEVIRVSSLAIKEIAKQPSNEFHLASVSAQAYKKAKEENFPRKKDWVLWGA